MKTERKTMQDRANFGTLEGASSSVRKPKSHKWWWIGGITLLVVTMLASVKAQFQTIPLRVFVETTHVTEPLRPNGDVDFLSALEQRMYSDQIATDENGFRLVLLHMGPSTDTSPEEFRIICEKVGVSPSAVKSDISYEEPKSFLKRRLVQQANSDIDFIRRLDAENGTSIEELKNTGLAYDEYEISMIVETSASISVRRTSKSWTLSDLPIMEGWLEQNNAALDLIAKAVRKTNFEIPYANYGTGNAFEDMSLDEIWRIRSFEQGLITRANYRLGSGDIDGAIDDILTCQIMGGHMREQFTMHGFFRHHDHATEGSVGIAGDLENQPTKQQLERLKDGITLATDDKHGFETVFLYKRLKTIDYIRHIADGGEINFYERKDERLKLIKKLGIDWNVVASETNAFFDGLIRGQSVGELLVNEEPSFMDWVTLRRRSKLIVPMFCASTSLANLEEIVMEALSREDCSDNLQQIVLAMLLYERDHGSLPPAYTFDNSGRPLHSWRVLLLPYLGQQELYDQIKLDEAWDSPHNQLLHRTDVPFYKCASDHDSRAGDTNYSVVVGPDTAFGKQGGKKLTTFGPESDDLILVIERDDKNVCWLDPTQELTQAVVEKGISSQHPWGAQVGLRDGSVQFLKKGITAELLQNKLRGTNEK